MKTNSSRRNFLSASVALPMAGLWRFGEGSQQTAGSPEKEVKLEYRTLGRTGLKVTTMGFGCMITSDPSVIERAADIGINYFDTARGYQGGNNERMVGAALKGKRKNVFISTKTGAGTKEEALNDLETSLRELGSDYVDVWCLHGRSSPSQVSDEFIEAQQLAKKQGKVRFSGVSTHRGQQELLPWLAEQGQIDVVIVAYNFAMDKSMEAAVEAAAKGGIGLVGMKVMAGGFRRPRPGDPTQEKLKRPGVMLAALKWVIRNPHIHTTIPSITDMDQLDENLKAMREAFGAAEEKLLARQLDYITPFYCRMCGECKATCAKGLPVEDILRHLTYAEGYGQFSLGREEFLKLGSEVAAVRCGDCEHCTVKCPFGVQVSARLSRAQELFA